MHTFLVISAYFTFILVPCACAQWGQYLTTEWWTLKMHYRRTAHLNDSLLQAIMEARLAAMEADEIAALSEAAFVPVPTPRFKPVRRRRIGHRSRLDLAAIAVEFERAKALVTARLMQLSESFRLAHTSTAELAMAYAMPQPAQANDALRKPSVRVLPLLEATHVHGTVTASQLVYATTPSADELEELYGNAQPVREETAA
jgi:hypothetical protein